MNAKVGKDMRIYNVGKHSLHKESNNNGMRLVDFSVSRNIVISITRFPHKDIHKETWMSPDSQTENQTDSVLIDARHTSDIIDVRSCRDATAICTIIWSKSNINQVYRQQIDPPELGIKSSTWRESKIEQLNTHGY
jgi:hypothetical protein